MTGYELFEGKVNYKYAYMCVCVCGKMGKPKAEALKIRNLQHIAGKSKRKPSENNKTPKPRKNIYISCIFIYNSSLGNEWKRSEKTPFNAKKNPNERKESVFLRIHMIIYSNVEWNE